MADYSAAKEIATRDTTFPMEYDYAVPSLLGTASIYKGMHLIRKPDGKIYAGTQTQNGRYAGMALNDATSTGTTTLKIARPGHGLIVKCTPASNIAEAADSYHATRLLSTDDDSTVDVKDHGATVWLNSDGEVTAHPKIPNSVPVGVLDVRTTGAEGAAVVWIQTFPPVSAPENWNKTGAFDRGPLELGGRSDFSIPARRVLLAKHFKKPILAAAASAGVYNLDQDEDFIVVGSAGTNVLASRGGTAVLTGGSDNDIVQIIPDSTTAYSLFDDTAWSQGLRLRCEWEFSVVSAADINIVVGMRVTVDGSTAAGDRATDDDAHFVSFDDDITGETTFQVIHEADNGGLFTATNTAVTPEAAKNYIFTLDFDEDGVARYYFKKQGDQDDTLVYTAAAVSSASTALKPTIAFQTRTGSAKTLNVYRVAVSQDIV